MLFFTETQGIPFTLFGPLHFALLFIVAAAITLIYIFRDKLRASKHHKALRYTFAGILFFNMTFYYLSLVFTGQYDVKKHLPLEFCFITGYFLMYILVSNNKGNLYNTIFYCTIIGPLPAMLWPNLPGSFDRLIFYQFVISHHFMMIVSFYCLIVLQYEVKNSGALKAFIYGNIVFISVSILNTFWGSNYIMQRKLPDHIPQIFPFVKYIDSPFFWLEFCGIIMLTLSIFIAHFFQRDKRPKITPESPSEAV